MNEDDEEVKDFAWASTPSKACFGMTPIQAFLMCREVFVRMGQDEEIKAEEAEKAKTQGRRALVEHTKKKNSQ
jgi:hypothetical protein